MTDLEIPFEKDRHGWYRFFEILPGFLSWGLLILPIVLSFINITIGYHTVNLAVFFILLYLLIYFSRAIAYSARAIAGYRTMKQHMKINWQDLLGDLEAGEVRDTGVKKPKWHPRILSLTVARPNRPLPSQLTHAVFIATVNETREVLEPTIQSLLDADYDTKQMILVMAYEGRAGQEAEDRVLELIKIYGKHFKHAMACKHPGDIPGEIKGKGPNITWAGRELQKYLEAENIDPASVIVTTLDSDNHPHPVYFANLTYVFCAAPDPQKASYQPLTMYTNNIWDAPTLMRVIATGNNLFYIVGSQRPHLVRNFSAHSQSMAPLIDMDFWSRRTVVEDGHHFWRSYFHHDGDYRVYPLSVPIYQDAVLADGYLRTMKAQFVQLQRWTYGASDVAYVAKQTFSKGCKAPRVDAVAKLLRLLEGHVTWATGPLLIYFAAFIPPLIHPQNLAANQLPLIVSTVQRVGIVGLLVSLYVCLVTLPPRPARYKRYRSIFMLTQWVFLPVTSVAYSSLAAFNSQTRLIFKRYLTRFNVTEKAVVTESGERLSSSADPELDALKAAAKAAKKKK